MNFDSEQDFEESYKELETNPDFTLLGYYKLVQDLYEELNYQGFSDTQIDGMSKAQYGTCLEILHYHDEYVAFMGER